MRISSAKGILPRPLRGSAGYLLRRDVWAASDGLAAGSMPTIPGEVFHLFISGNTVFRLRRIMSGSP